MTIGRHFVIAFLAHAWAALEDLDFTSVDDICEMELETQSFSLLQKGMEKSPPSLPQAPSQLPLVDVDSQANGTVLMQQGKCEHPPGTCMCTSNLKYPCYKEYGSGCACWSYSSRLSCEGAGGSFCNCGENCELCRDATECSTCKEGYMLIQGRCAKMPAEEKDVWVRSHNILRCMHGSPPVKWSKEVADNAKAYVNNLKNMVYSRSYDIPPPAGPAGENLAEGSSSPKDVTLAWYSELDCCYALPGCNQGTCVTSHFTAMVWKGVTEIGCAVNEADIAICRYRSGDTINKETANMQGHYEEMVLPATKGLAECIAEADTGFQPPPTTTKDPCQDPVQ
mmetsp:Transcript_11205/g.25126  ORF Transcript_11205/g.25126 Transcript_11205/m.25126 type:complete len:338 (-) Transcript_11205:105-1118(-)